MTPAQVALQLVGSLGALVAIAFAVRTYRRDLADRRLPLARTVYPLAGLAVVLGAFGLLVPVLWAIFTSGLLPKGEPLVFTLFLTWMALGFVASLLAVLPPVMRRSAVGNITLVDDRTLRLEAEGAVHTLTLGPGKARLTFCAGPTAGAWVQLALTDERRTIFVYGLAPLRSLKWVEAGPPSAPQGLLLSGQAGPLIEWARPFLVQRNSVSAGLR